MKLGPSTVDFVSEADANVETTVLSEVINHKFDHVHLSHPVNRVAQHSLHLCKYVQLGTVLITGLFIVITVSLCTQHQWEISEERGCCMV